MFSIKNSRNYIIVNDKASFEEAKRCDVCGFIIWEDKNTIKVWENLFGKWVRTQYTYFGEQIENDEETTGLKAYQSFYNYCGKEEVERMKSALSPISMFESFEQMHYFNFEHANEKIYKDIYEFDANSSFTYGVTRLPEEFNKLKEYMLMLYEKKKNAPNKIQRSKYKNLQNFLIGYFARVKEFVRVRSDIIMYSNENIQERMVEIQKAGGEIYLSNTDSIVTDSIGAEVMKKHLGTDVGKFKLSTKTDKLFYKSSNAYQLGEKIVFSGVKYFARKHTDFFSDLTASQKGSLIQGYDFCLDSDGTYSKVCKIRNGKIEVFVVNALGELMERIEYTLEAKK